VHDRRPRASWSAAGRAVALGLIGLCAAACSGSGGSVDDPETEPEAGAPPAPSGSGDEGPNCPFAGELAEYDLDEVILEVETEYSMPGVDDAPPVTVRFDSTRAVESLQLGDGDPIPCTRAENVEGLYNDLFYPCNDGKPDFCRECFDTYTCGDCQYYFGNNPLSDGFIWALTDDCTETHYDVAFRDPNSTPDPPDPDECSSCLSACRGLPACCTGTGCICDSDCPG
jgi:hypothetical protein